MRNWQQSKVCPKRVNMQINERSGQVEKVKQKYNEKAMELTTWQMKNKRLKQRIDILKREESELR